MGGKPADSSPLRVGEKKRGCWPGGRRADQFLGLENLDFKRSPTEGFLSSRSTSK